MHMSELLNSKPLVKPDKIRYVSYERCYDSPAILFRAQLPEFRRAK